MATTENGIYYPDDKTEKATILSDLQKMAKSIDTAINNNKFDPTQINNSIQELEVDISDLQESQEEQNSDIEALTNALPSETQEDENINIKGTIPVKFKEFKLSGNSKQESRSGKNLLPYPYDRIANTIIQDLGDGRLILNGSIDTNTSRTIKTFELKAGNYKFLFNTSNLPNNSYFYIRNQTTLETIYRGIRSNKNFVLEEDTQIQIELVLVTGEYSNFELDLMILNATEEDETWEQYGAMPSPEYPSEIQNIEGNVNVTVANKEKTEQQTVLFPLAQGQKLMLGDYLAEDGIHHKRTQFEADGINIKVAGIYKFTNGLYYCTVGIPFKSINGSKVYSTHFKGQQQNIVALGNCYITANGGLLVFVLEDQNITTVEDANNWLIQQKQAGTPVKFECELAEEEIEPHTEEQQEVYNQLMNLKAYEDETNIFSTNEISPIFKVTAIKDFNSVITQLNQLILEGGN